jgi:hypothetical protein
MSRKIGSIPPDLVDRMWQVYSEFTYIQNGCPVGSTDKLHWLAGISTAFAAITGAMDLGIPEGTPSIEVMAQIINKELPAYKDEIDRLVNNARENGLRSD